MQSELIALDKQHEILLSILCKVDDFVRNIVSDILWQEVRYWVL